MQDFTNSLPMKLYRALDEIMPRFRKIFSQFGLTEQQWRVLRVLWEHDNITPRDLAAITLIPNPSLVGIVDRLSANGLVNRQPSAADRRSVLIQATEEGHRLEHQVQPLIDQVYTDLQHSVHPRTWEQLLSGLDVIAGDTSTKSNLNHLANENTK